MPYLFEKQVLIPRRATVGAIQRGELLQYRMLSFFVAIGVAYGQTKTSLPVWKADPKQVDQLGKAFEHPQIKIRPPRDLEKVDRENPPEMSKLGVYNFGWTPAGAFPSLEIFRWR